MNYRVIPQHVAARRSDKVGGPMSMWSPPPPTTNTTRQPSTVKSTARVNDIMAESEITHLVIIFTSAEGGLLKRIKLFNMRKEIKTMIAVY